jgi:hypothetical protein
MLLTPNAGAAPNPAKLMRIADSRHRVGNEQFDAVMVLQKKNGPQRKRKMRWMIRQDDRSGDRALVRFLAPASIKGTAMLTVENVGGEDDQWLYLPAFRRTRRVGSGELGDRFAGSDIYNEDFKRRRPHEYRFKLLGSAKVDGHDCWVIESRPKSAKVRRETPYGKSMYWMRKDVMFIVQARHFDRRLRPLKQVKMTDLKRVGRRAIRPNKQIFFDVQRQHRTVILINNRRTDLVLRDGLFSRNALKSL